MRIVATIEKASQAQPMLVREDGPIFKIIIERVDSMKQEVVTETN